MKYLDENGNERICICPDIINDERDMCVSHYMKKYNLKGLDEVNKFRKDESHENGT